MRLSLPVLSMLLGLGCAGASTSTSLPPSPPLASTSPAVASAAASVSFPGSPLSPPETTETRIFAAQLAKLGDVSVEQVLRRVRSRSYPTTLSFNPTSAKHFIPVSKALDLTREEWGLFEKHGMVSVDHARRYSMASAYYAIYARDLPVLVTTDSILHALHRSYDAVLMSLETGIFVKVLDDVLERVHAELAKTGGTMGGPGLRTSVGDVDVYVTTARNLLAGAAATGEVRGVSPWDGKLKVRTRTGRDAEVLTALRGIASLSLRWANMYGGRRPVDFSQFRVRGHYTASPVLAKYFRTMMWLGRADLGWFVVAPAPQSGLVVDSEREGRNAALLTQLLETSGQLPRLEAMGDVIDFMVGDGDELSPLEMRTVLSKVKLQHPAQLAGAASMGKIRTEVERGGLASQQIRSQFLWSPQSTVVKTPVPALFQVFGQRFLIDSFVLSKVVYDSIIYGGEKQTRMMPSGLDVAAALGNDEAVALLEPELRKFKYGANLLAARTVVDSYGPPRWNGNLYNIWLDSLRTLDEDPSSQRYFPQVMRTRLWQRKQLQTQLASWAELRHDTLLYAKQSYSAVPICGYPAGFVEPYPAFYARIKDLASHAAERLSTADLTKTNPAFRTQVSAFFRGFAGTMDQLERLARKELSAKPFTAKEAAFLKKLIDQRGGGSGPPRYDGWYTRLIYGSGAGKWTPTVADVHTAPSDDMSKRVLHVGVGDANLLMVAVDNQNDRAVYVGPVYTYYEFRSATRLTDEAWQERILHDKVPERPDWTSQFRAPPVKRSL